MKKQTQMSVAVGVLGLATMALSAAAAPPSDCMDAARIVNFALKNHLIYNQMTPELAKRTIDRFVEMVLVNKGVLTTPDVQSVKLEAEQAQPERVGTGMTMADCSFFQNEKLILETAFSNLRKTFKGPAVLSPELMSSSASQPLTEEEKNNPADTVAILRGRIVQTLSEQVQGWMKTVPVEVAARFVATAYLKSLDKFGNTLADYTTDKMLKAFLFSLDPHSNYQSESELKEFRQRFLQSSFSGIGVSFDRRITPYGPQVISLIEGGAAAKNGQIKPKDIVVSIDGRSTVGMDHEEFGALAKGPAGTSVSVTVAQMKDQKLTEFRTVNLVRETVKNSGADITSLRKTVNGKQIVTIELAVFYKGATDDLQEAIEIQKKKGRIDALILDLRGNPGGALEDAVGVAGLFIRKGPIVEVSYARGGDVKEDKDSLVQYDGPLLIAVNNASASASEIVAGSLKDLHRALIVGGPHTYGKGTVQNVITDPRFVPKGGLVLTIGQFYTVGGASTQMSGVSSHITVPGPSIPEAYEERNQKFAIPASKIPSFISKDEESKLLGRKGKAADKMIAQLAGVSAGRVAARPKGFEADFASQTDEIQNIAADYASMR